MVNSYFSCYIRTNAIVCGLNIITRILKIYFIISLVADLLFELCYDGQSFPLALAEQSGSGNEELSCVH